jgi:hypothetical protein
MLLSNYTAWARVSNDDMRVNRQRNGIHSENVDIQSPRGGQSLMHEADLSQNSSDGQI